MWVDKRKGRLAKLAMHDVGTYWELGISPLGLSHNNVDDSHVASLVPQCSARALVGPGFSTMNVLKGVESSKWPFIAAGVFGLTWV
jgi:hypothetical protein